MPTLAASFTVVSAASDLTTLTTASFTPTVGDVIVVKAATENSNTHVGTPSDGQGNAYTSRATSTVVSTCEAKVFTAVTASAASMTVSCTFTTTSGFHSMTVERWTGAALAGTPAVNGTKTGTGAPTSTITSTLAGSVITWCNGDFAAVSPASRTYNTTSATPSEEGLHDKSGTGNYVSYFAWQTAASAASQTFGLTAPTGQTWTLLAIEILPGAPTQDQKQQELRPPWRLWARDRSSIFKSTWQLFATSDISTGAFLGLATEAVTSVVAPSGQTEGSISVPVTAGITTLGAAAGSTFVALSVAITAAGVLGFTGAAVTTETVTVTSAGGATGSTSVTETVTVTAAGNMAATGSAPVAETVSTTVAGGGAGSAAVAVTSSIAAAGVLTTGGVAPEAVTVSITAAAGTSSSAPRAVTSAIAPAGTTGSGSAVAVAAAITAVGSLTGTAPRSTTVTVTAAGNMAATGTTAEPIAVAIQPSGETRGATTRTAAVAVTASGVLFIIPPSADGYATAGTAQVGVLAVAGSAPTGPYAYSGSASQGAYAGRGVP